MAKTLAEVKVILKTDRVFETETAFLVNSFGKYSPNITFVIQKDFEQNPLAYRMDPPTKQMLANMNVDFSGETAVLFGDFWTSKKGGACFRPKSVADAQHVLIRVTWGGAFSRTRGVGQAEGASYLRRASSNGGGMGADYVVVPVGFYRVVRDVEIDGETKSAAVDFVQRAAVVREQIARFDQEQADKVTAEAKAKVATESASRAAKAAGLGARVTVASAKLVALGHDAIEQDDTYFGSRWSKSLYTEATVTNIEQHVADLERQRAEAERKRAVRETFTPQFEVFRQRVDTLGITIEFRDEHVSLGEDYYSHTYSDEGVAALAANLDRREQEAAAAKAKADAEAVYQLRKTRAQELGLPTDIRIWCRRGGRTNAGDGWVIGSDGQDRGNTTWYNPRPRYSSEGNKIWEQILEGELVLKWSKSSSASEHKFEVVNRPPSLTEAQLERVKEIEDELEKEWEGARGLASGIPSPSVGEGWGLVPAALEVPDVGVKSAVVSGEFASQDALAALKAKFGGGK